jgi:hypothetical protein
MSLNYTFCNLLLYSYCMCTLLLMSIYTRPVHFNGSAYVINRTLDVQHMGRLCMCTFPVVGLILGMLYKNKQKERCTTYTLVLTRATYKHVDVAVPIASNLHGAVCACSHRWYGYVWLIRARKYILYYRCVIPFFLWYYIHSVFTLNLERCTHIVNVIHLSIERRARMG